MEPPSPVKEMNAPEPEMGVKTELKVEVLPPIIQTQQAADDVYMSIATGGGGYGDPIRRDPGMVLKDVRYGAVTISHAAAMYGVAIAKTDGSLAIDIDQTTELRAAIRAQRHGLGSD